MQRVRHAAPFLSVAGLGALVLHQLVYGVLRLVGHTHLTGDHGHLATQWAILTPLAVVGAAVLVLRQIRGLGYRPRSTVGLSAAAALLFLTQEVIEATAIGGSPSDFLVSPAALLGLLLSPIVWAAIHKLLTGAAAVMARLVLMAAMPVLGSSADPGRGGLPVDTSVALRNSPARGPPLLLG